MGGTIAKHVHQGMKVGICDLTKAELSSNGTVNIRQEEANKVNKILGITERYNLSFPDRGLQYSESKIKDIVTLIRNTQPTTIFLPYPEDRHPDHGGCTRLVEEAIFSAGIKKYLPELKQHKTTNVYYYMINGFHKPPLIVDITEYIEIKINALKAYESQFVQGINGEKTPLTDDYIDVVIAREKLLGKEVGIKYAEGFFTKKPHIVHNF
jgi:N-acetylglucosamine malate deacetylase 1